MNYLRSMILVATLILGTGTALSQEEGIHSSAREVHEPGERVREHHKHSLSILLSHAHILNGFENGGIRGINRPAWMVAYNYSISERWAVGLHGDIIIETFEVETQGSDSENGLLEREYPISLVGAASFKVMDHLAVLLGGGLEFDQSESFGLMRIGLEPFLRLSPRIELLLNLSYDVKFDAYDNWNLGFGIAYGLGK